VVDLPVGLGAREAGRLANCPGLWLATLPGSAPLSDTSEAATAEEATEEKPRSVGAAQDAGRSQVPSEGSGRGGGERPRVAGPGFCDCGLNLTHSRHLHENSPLKI
jgi:hypothetical protein